MQKSLEFSGPVFFCSYIQEMMRFGPALYEVGWLALFITTFTSVDLLSGSRSLLSGNRANLNDGSERTRDRLAFA